MPEEENEKNRTEHLEPFGPQEIRELLSLLGHTDVTELLIERGTARLHIKRGGGRTLSRSARFPLPTPDPSAPPGGPARVERINPGSAWFVPPSPPARTIAPAPRK